MTQNTTPKIFPIMHGFFLKAIPLNVIEPHDEQAQRNHSQSLTRLAERGGLSPLEALLVLTDEPPNPFPATSFGEAEFKIIEMLIAGGTHPL